MSKKTERTALRAQLKTLRQGARVELVREGSRRAGSQAKLAHLLVRETRQVERWLSPTFPSPVPIKVLERLVEVWPDLRKRAAC